VRHCVLNLPSSDNVLLKQFPDDIDKILNVDLVDETVDALLEGFPGQALELFAGLVFDLLLHHAQASRGNVRTA
jgi:hypothetical protein